jgi:alkylation response protein AidB-like acyl-CoA dehydrogenase
MRLLLTPDQIALQETLREMLAKECTTILVRQAKADPAADVWSGLWHRLTDFGIWDLLEGVGTDSPAGGVFDLGLFFREAGRFLCPSLVADTVLFGLIVSRLGDDTQRATYFEPLLAGNLRAAVAITAADDGLDLRPRLIAEPVDGGWRVSGCLPFVENTQRADVVLVTASTTDFVGSVRTIVGVFDPRSPGITNRTRRMMSGDEFVELSFSDVFLPAHAALGHARDERDRVDLLIRVAHTAIAWQCMEMVGGAEEVVNRVRVHVINRHQFGRAIGSYQAVQHMVADIHIGIETGRLPALKATWLCGRGETPMVAVARAKMLCNEMYKFATLTAHQLHGGMGFLRESDLHLWSERAKLADLRRGSGDVAAGWLGKALGLTNP